MRWTTEVGSVLRSAATSCAPTPAGARRRPLSRTSVRDAPRPRRPTVFAPWPLSERKPRKLPLICDVPEVTVRDWRASVVERVPGEDLIVAGEDVDVLRGGEIVAADARTGDDDRAAVVGRRRLETAWPSALVGSLDGGSASPSAVFSGVELDRRGGLGEGG